MGAFPNRASFVIAVVTFNSFVDSLEGDLEGALSNAH